MKLTDKILKEAKEVQDYRKGDSAFFAIAYKENIYLVDLFDGESLNSYALKAAPQLLDALYKDADSLYYLIVDTKKKIVKYPEDGNVFGINR